MPATATRTFRDAQPTATYSNADIESLLLVSTDRGQLGSQACLGAAARNDAVAPRPGSLDRGDGSPAFFERPARGGGTLERTRALMFWRGCMRPVAGALIGRGSLARPVRHGR